MFRSSRPKGWGARLRDLVWPRIGFERAWNYRVCRLSRLQLCPHKISLGFAAGAFASFTPFIGLHFLLAAFIALVLRGSLLASAAGTVVGNPLTFPLIWMATFKLGNVLTGWYGHATVLNAESLPIATADVSGSLWEGLADAVWPMLVGAVPLGLVGAVVSYAFCYWSLGKVRRRPSRRSSTEAMHS